MKTSTDTIVAVLAALSIAALSSTAQAQGKALDDPTIVAIFDAANTWDMETGALGAARGTTKEVRDFGRMMVRDHRAVRQQGRDLAKRLGVTPTAPADTSMLADHHKAMRELKRLHGKAFDRAYIAHEAAYHKAVIEAVTNTLLPATQNADLKALEVRVAPAFQAHMMAAERLQQKMVAAK
jgi:putative membrane protein